MTPPRYAIYFAPEPDSLLWRVGCQWLGRDPERDVEITQPAVAGFDAQRLRALTESPRSYGFHATLKPPFHLIDGSTVADLTTAMRVFAAQRRIFHLPPLEPARLSRFLALRPMAASAQLQALADACVIEFDSFRRPSDPEEIVRRRAVGLTQRQEALLQCYGYPYVLDQFRLHFTLTDPVEAQAAEILLPWLVRYFSAALRDPVPVAGVSLFAQERPSGAFRLVQRFAFRPA